MTLLQRFRKRMAILFATTAIAGAVGISMFLSLYPTPNCFDGKRNQGETGIDCGGPCQACVEEYDPEPFSVVEAALVPGGDPDEYDVVARVYNPNDELGAEELSYEFRFKDRDGLIVGSVSGEGFILPQETKTFMEIGIDVPGDPVSVEAVFSGSEWERFSGFQEKPPMSAVNVAYRELSSGPFFSEAVGTLINDSDYDFESVLVRVILRDASGTPVAFNQTEINTLLSKENRDFVFRWPKAFPGTVARVDVEPDVEFFGDANLFERSRGTEQSQQFR